MKAIYCIPGFDPKLVEIENTLEALQEAVGGYIECVPAFEDAVIICNEEGLIRALEPQKVLGQFFFGDVLIVGVDGEEFTDVPEAGIELFHLWEAEA